MNLAKKCLAFVAIAALMVSITGCNINFSNGEGQKVGQVVKFSKQGFLKDTWEGQLIRGGMTGGSGTIGTAPFDFTVENEALAKQVEQHMVNQTEVSIKYRIEGLSWYARSESKGHFLVSIEPLKK